MSHRPGRLRRSAPLLAMSSMNLNENLVQSSSGPEIAGVILPGFPSPIRYLLTADVNHHAFIILSSICWISAIAFVIVFPFTIPSPWRRRAAQFLRRYPRICYSAAACFFSIFSSVSVCAMLVVSYGHGVSSLSPGHAAYIIRRMFFPRGYRNTAAVICGAAWAAVQIVLVASAWRRAGSRSRSRQGAGAGAADHRRAVASQWVAPPWILPLITFATPAAVIYFAIGTYHAQVAVDRGIVVHQAAAKSMYQALAELTRMPASNVDITKIKLPSMISDAYFRAWARSRYRLAVAREREKKF